MTTSLGFSANDAERQAGDAAANYLDRALRILAGRIGLEKSLGRDPAAFVSQFAPLLSALVEAQAREYQSWVIFSRLGAIDGSMLSGLADLAERWDEQNAGTCRKCAIERRVGA